MAKKKLSRGTQTKFLGLIFLLGLTFDKSINYVWSQPADEGNPFIGTWIMDDDSSFEYVYTKDTLTIKLDGMIMNTFSYTFDSVKKTITTVKYNNTRYGRMKSETTHEYVITDDKLTLVGFNKFTKKM